MLTWGEDLISYTVQINSLRRFGTVLDFASMSPLLQTEVVFLHTKTWVFSVLCCLQVTTKPTDTAENSHKNISYIYKIRFFSITLF